jgi:hypothetical protein
MKKTIFVFVTINALGRITCIHWKKDPAIAAIKDRGMRAGTWHNDNCQIYNSMGNPCGFLKEWPVH